MRWIALLTLAAVASGCTTPLYAVRSTDLNLPAVPAVRVGDGRPVLLAGGLQPESPTAYADGTVRVRGRRSKLWMAGMGVTLIGAALAITGAALGIAGFNRGNEGCGDITEHPCYDDPSTPPALEARRAEGDRMFAAGLSIGLIGDVALLVGPALWIAGAFQRPDELK
jgi:hypothetical protein